MMKVGEEEGTSSAFFFKINKMKNKAVSIVFILFGTFYLPCFCQETAAPEGTSEEEFLQQTAQDSWLIKRSALLPAGVELNSVFITQIGEDNDVVYDVSSPKAEIHLDQIGDLNNMQMQLSGYDITEEISQEGIGNFFYEVSLDTPENTFGLLKKETIIILKNMGQLL